MQMYPLQMMDIPDKPFNKIAIDLVTDLNVSTSDKEHILTFIDHLTGWPEAISVPDENVDTIVHVFINNYLSVYMCPRYKLSDNSDMIKKGESHTVSSYQDPRFHTNNRPMVCVTYNYLLYSGVLLVLFLFLGHACALYTNAISIWVCPLIPDC